MQLEEWIGKRVRLRTGLCVRWMKGRELSKSYCFLPASCVFTVRSVYEQRLDLEERLVLKRGKSREPTRVVLHVPIEDVLLLE